MRHPTTLLAAAGLIALALATPASAPVPGLVKIGFTPVQLLEKSSAISVMTAAPAGEGKVALTPVRDIRGAGPGAVTLALSPDQVPVSAVLAKGGTVVWLVGDFSEAAVGGAAAGGGETPVAMLSTGPELEGGWVAVVKTEAGYEVRKDAFDLNGVWGGGADLLARCLDYIIAEGRRADVPVLEGFAWSGERRLGQVAAPVDLALLVELAGAPALALSGTGAALVRGAGVTPLAGPGLVLGTADPDGDGRAELIRWDGAGVLAVAEGGDRELQRVAEVRSLSAIGSGGASLPVAFTAAGPVLIKPGAPAWPGLPAEAGAGSAGTVADLDRDGIPDLAQACARGLVVWKGQADGGMAAPTLAYAGRLPALHTLIAVDLDNDDALDLVGGAAREKHVPYLHNLGGLRFRDRNVDTGELDYHAPDAGSRGSFVWDPNLDGRPDMLLVSPSQGPKAYFSRGFAAYGLGRAVNPNPSDEAQKKLAAIQAMAKGGVQTGGVLDVDGDQQPDVVTVTRDSAVWAMTTKGAVEGRVGLTVALPAGMPGPVTVVARDGGRSLGARSVMPGQPALFGKTAKGPLVLSWTTPTGQARTQTVVVTAHRRIELPKP